MKLKDSRIFFKVLQACSRLEKIDYDLYIAAQCRFESQLYAMTRRRVNGRGDLEAICTAAARHFGVTPRSAPR